VEDLDFLGQLAHVELVGVHGSGTAETYATAKGTEPDAEMQRRAAATLREQRSKTLRRMEMRFGMWLTTAVARRRIWISFVRHAWSTSNTSGRRGREKRKARRLEIFNPLPFPLHCRPSPPLCRRFYDFCYSCCWWCVYNRVAGTTKGNHEQNFRLDEPSGEPFNSQCNAMPRRVRYRV